VADTDSPLKVLVRDFAPDFAAWLLGMDPAAIVAVHPENIELPAGRIWSDTILHVTLSNGQTPVLHIEFQGPRSERPMQWRMLDYMSRLAQQGSSPLCSAVIYVGDGAGIHDSGEYQVACPDGSLALAWRYRVIRLWQMAAEELLALRRPALVPLLGQTRIAQPEQVLPVAVAAIGQVADYGQRVRLFDAFASLMRDEEVLTMAERLIEAMDEGLLMDTPFLRRSREKGLAQGLTQGLTQGLAQGLTQGLAQGLAQGRAEGRAEGLAEGRVAGRLEELKKIILDVLAARLQLTVSQYRGIENAVEALADETRLRSLLRTAILAGDAAEFEAALAASG
jgi:predicted transposase YdaD